MAHKYLENSNLYGNLQFDLRNQKIFAKSAIAFKSKNMYILI